MVETVARRFCLLCGVIEWPPCIPKVWPSLGERKRDKTVQRLVDKRDLGSIEASWACSHSARRRCSVIHALTSAAVVNALTVVGSSHGVTTSTENASSAGVTQ